jgi:uncharacterized delta-60 repeat protein
LNIPNSFHPPIAVLHYPGTYSTLCRNTPLKNIGMKKIYLLLLAILQLLSLPLLAQLDITFSGDGRASANILSGAYGEAVLIQPKDQKIVVAGYYNDGTLNNIGLVRFTISGDLDTLFGIGGRVLLPFSVGTVSPYRVAIQSNGNIIVSGQFFISTGAGREAVLIRLTPTGKIDYSFSPTGYLVVPQFAEAYALLVQADDKIVVGGNGGSGFGVIRFSKDGVPDTGFGSGGMFTMAGKVITAMAFESDGSIIATGYTSGSVVQTVHLSTTGVLDRTFGAGGVSTLTVGTNDAIQIYGVTVIGNNWIVLTGNYLPQETNSTFHFLVAELRADGTLNPTFAGNGKLGIAVPNYTAYGWGSVQLLEGQLVIAGELVPKGSGPVQVGLARISANGVPDPAFGPNGVQIVGWSNKSTNVGAIAIALQSNQEIVVGGGLGAGLDLGGLMAMRFRNPVIIPPPPVVDAIASAEENRASSTELPLRLFPNPANKTLNIQGLDASVTTAVQVSDAAGRIVLSARTSGATLYTLDISRLPSATYFFTLITDTHRKTLTFVKTR